MRFENKKLPSVPRLKVIAFCLLMICSCETLFCQSLKISHNGNDLTNKEVTIEGNATDDELGLFPVITNTDDKAVQVKVRKIEISIVQGTQNAFCFGVCYAPYVYESSFPCAIAAGKSTKDSLFAVAYIPNGFAGKSVIKYEIFDISDPENNKVSVTVDFICSPGTGIERNFAGNKDIRVYPDPCSGDRINFRLSAYGTGNTGKIFIYSSLGNVVDVISSTGLPGSFSAEVGDYPGGIYYYSLQYNTKQIFSGKFIIVH